tara:strand:- start:901 stop:1074 length:174 start_codon:yes stop_codon:yes gene_type:complete
VDTSNNHIANYKDLVLLMNPEEYYTEYASYDDCYEDEIDMIVDQDMIDEWEAEEDYE